MVVHTTPKSGKRYHFLMAKKLFYFNELYHLVAVSQPLRTPTLLSQNAKYNILIFNKNTLSSCYINRQYLFDSENSGSK